MGRGRRSPAGPVRSSLAPVDPEAPAIPEAVTAVAAVAAQTGDADLTAVHRLDDFVELARERIPIDAFDYVAGGSWDELTLDDNIRAFQRRQLRPRVLIDVSTLDLRTTMLGIPVSMPVALAPTAFHRMVHPEAEAAVARAAASAGVLMTLSTFSSLSMEEVAAAADGPRWFQLYVHRERAATTEIVGRAEAAGYRAIVLTVDLPVPGYRERDLRNHLRHPDRLGSLALDGAPGMAFQAIVAGFTKPALTWDDLGWLRGLSSLPLIVKGIMTGEDAALAVEHGAAAIVVSNHGGRQLDRVAATIDVLEEVVEAVDGRVEVYLDGGVRRATDVLTALALGAQAVFIGRPYLFALGAAGEAGVAHALGLLRTELLTAMPLLGVRTPAEVTRRHVR